MLEKSVKIENKNPKKVFYEVLISMRRINAETRIFIKMFFKENL
jgi:hypothetical protein